MIKANISKFTRVKQKSEAELKKTVAQPPVSIYVQVFQFYNREVVTSDCVSGRLWI